MENQELVMPEQTQPPVQPDLTVSDLNNIRQIIDAAVRRGTFSASEISGVGAAYDKLDKFLNSLNAQQQTNPKQ
jgi:hypothetical protein